MDAESLGSLLLWRALERLIGVLIGGASVYLGYRLFLSLPERKEEGEGKLFLPGDISVYVGRVGPGVFFALFGAAIVGFSFVRPVEVAFPEGTRAAGPSDAAGPGADPATPVATFSYLSGEPRSGPVDSERAGVVRDVRRLAALEAALEQFVQGGGLPLSDTDATSALLALPRVKRMMLRSVWDPGWGEYPAFAAWVGAGAPEPPPPETQPAAQIFRGGSEP